MIALFDFLSFLFAAAAVTTVAWNYRSLPERVPIHFGIRGYPDGWASRPWIWLLPVMAVGLYALMGDSLPVKPSERFLVSLVRMESLAMLFYIVRGQVLVAVGAARKLGNGIWVLTLLMVVTALLASRGG